MFSFRIQMVMKFKQSKISELYQVFKDYSANWTGKKEKGGLSKLRLYEIATLIVVPS